MALNFNSPRAKIITFLLEPETGYYRLISQPPGFNRIPNELKVEDTQRPDILTRGANLTIRGRQRNKRFLFFTGMLPTPFQNVFVGDDGYLRPQKKSMVLFIFSPDSSRLDLHYFQGFTIYPPHREQFIRNYLKRIR